jgi:hypothetical protein
MNVKWFCTWKLWVKYKQNGWICEIVKNIIATLYFVDFFFFKGSNLFYMLSPILLFFFKLYFILSVIRLASREVQMLIQYLLNYWTFFTWSASDNFGAYFPFLLRCKGPGLALPIYIYIYICPMMGPPHNCFKSGPASPKAGPGPKLHGVTTPPCDYLLLRIIQSDFWWC